MTTDAVSTDVLETLIEHACRKLNVSKETDICKYLSVEGERIHHFTYKKMKKNSSGALLKMIKEQIIESESPQIAASKPRSARASSYVTLKLERSHVGRISKALEACGESDLAGLFQVEPSLKEMKKQVLQSIRSGRPDKKLIADYLKRSDV